jgi:hypothetical protein
VLGELIDFEEGHSASYPFTAPAISPRTK